MADVWELIEKAPENVEATADLYSWSLNYDAGKGPFILFLDLIGYSEDEYGDPMYSLKDASLGYLELTKLGYALTEYSSRPHDVREFVDQLMTAESES